MSTDGVEASERFEFWHDVVCDRFTKLDAQLSPGCEAEFAGRIVGSDIGVVRVSVIRATGHGVMRTAKLISREESDDVLIDLPIAGTGALSQDDRQAVLNPGDFALCDLARPFSYRFPGSIRQVVLQFPRSVLFGRDAMFSRMTAVAVPGDRGVGALVSRFVQSLAEVDEWQQSTVAAQIGSNIIDLVSTSLAERLGEGARVSSRRYHLERAKQFLHEHQHELDLSPTRAAAAIGISTRYLHTLFHDEGTTVSRWLAEGRLERARAMLADGSRVAISVADIGFAVGFRNATHFSRAFKTHFGISPRECRLAADRSSRDENPCSMHQRAGSPGIRAHDPAARPTMAAERGDAIR